VGRCTIHTPALPTWAKISRHSASFVPLNPGAPQQSGLDSHPRGHFRSQSIGDTMLVFTSGYNRHFHQSTPELPSGTPLLAAFNRAESPENVFIDTISPPRHHLEASRPDQQIRSAELSSTKRSGFLPSRRAERQYPHRHSECLHWTGRGSKLGAEPGTWPLGGCGLDATTADFSPSTKQVAVTPCAAGWQSRRTAGPLVVANFGNDSITVFKPAYAGSTNWSAGEELDLRPARATRPGGVRRANIHSGWLLKVPDRASTAT